MRILTLIKNQGSYNDILFSFLSSIVCISLILHIFIKSVGSCIHHHYQVAEQLNLTTTLVLLTDTLMS